MFRKLVSNLPFNPSMLGTLSFYAKRMNDEAALRRIGFGFVALAMFIQMFAVMAPPERSLANSGNDIISTTIRTRDDLLRAWDGKTADRNVAAIYSRFGITRADIAALPMYPNAKIRSTAADFWSIGRSSLSASSRSGQIKQAYKNAEVPVNYGSGTVYLRPLRSWDIANPYNDYVAFTGHKNGRSFSILIDCGNLTFIGKPPLNTPRLELRKTIDGGPRALKPGQTFVFRFEYRNPVPDSNPVTNAVLTDQLDLARFDIVHPKGLNIKNGLLTFPIGTVPYSANFKTALTITARLKSNLANGAKTCNAATLRGTGVPSVSSGGSNLCITVLNPCPLDSSLSQTDPRCTKPVLACTLTNSDINRTIKSFTLKTVVTSSNQRLTSIQSYVYDFGDGSPVQTRKSSAYSDTVSHTYKDGSFNATVVVNYRIGTGANQTDGSVNCSEQIDSEPDKPLGQEKTARNLTQNLDENATPGSKAKAGDTIEYSLVTNNSYGYDRTNVNVSDHIGDILDYADLDLAFLASQGGSFDEESKTLSWSNQTIKANSKLANNFRVKLKNPLPSTNQPNAMTTTFDCQMSNKFGNQLDIEIDCPFPKITEQVAQQLPSTGPGTSLIIGFVATSVFAYFFARSRLLAQELEIIRTDFAQTGGI